MKIVLANAPFRTYNGKFLKKDITLEKIKDNLNCKIDYLYKRHLSPFLQEKINLKLHLNKEGFRYGVRAGSRWPWTAAWPHGDAPYPFMMGYSAALLKENGFEVNILDAVVNEFYSCEKFVEKIKKENPDIVIIESAAVTMDIDLWTAKQVSEFAEVALAGPHFTDDIALSLKEENPYIKYFLKGEYIKSSLKMAQTRESGIYDSEIVTDLDSIPFPFRDYEGAEKYYEVTMPTPRPQLQIYASKGCPFKCKFCMWPQTMYKGNVAQRSPEKIAEEIRLNVEKYGYKSILFDDDTFNIGNERISKLCDYLKEIGLPWTMMGRLDSSPDWLFDKMVDSGCVGMRFGVETFDIECLKKINKGLERVDFQGTLKHLSEKYSDLWLHLTMMKDMPGQTEEIHQKDMKILEDLGFSIYGSCDTHRHFQLSHCVPYKGTQLYKEMMELLGNEFDQKNIQYDGMSDTIMSELNKRGLWDKTNTTV